MTAGDTRVREARGEDRAAIEDVTLAAYAQFAEVMLPERWAFYRDSILATLDSIGPAIQFVASRGEGLVGSVLLYPSGATVAIPGTEPVVLASPEVRLLAVAPSARRHGVGEALLRACIERARHAHSGYLLLHTTDMMQAAIDLYTHMGFERAPDLDSRPFPEIAIKGYRLDLESAAHESRGSSKST